MALSADFKRHLHELMIEVADKTRDEEVAYANQLKGRAPANSSAFPIAIKDAKLHAMESRVGKTIAKYIEAVSIWGLTVDDQFERDMVNEFSSLTAAPNQLQFPPAINHSSHAQAVNRSYSMELQRLQNRLVREGANRLRELKMKIKLQSNSHTTASVTNLTFHAPVKNLYNNSVDQSVTVIQSQIDLNALSIELESLRLHLAQSASTPSDYAQLQLVAEAREAAEKREGNKASQFLAKGGKLLLDAATDFGAKVTAELIAKQMGLK